MVILSLASAFKYKEECVWYVSGCVVCGQMMCVLCAYGVLHGLCSMVCGYYQDHVVMGT